MVLPQPLIRHLVVGGLKSFGNPPTRIELAPLTLIFGPNSAGKSSLLSALTLLRQSATAGRPLRLRLRGELTDAGSYRLAVHKHDPDQRITLGLGFVSPEPGKTALVAPMVEREIRFGYSWDSDHNCPGDTRLSLDIGGYRATFTVDGDGQYRRQEVSSAAAEWDDFLASLAVAREVLPPLEPLLAQPLLSQAEDSYRSAVGLAEAGDGSLADIAADPLRHIRLMLSVQLQGELFEVLRRVAFLGPIRARPDQTTAVATGVDTYVGPAGELVTELLARDSRLLAATNDWLDRLGLGYRVQILVPDTGELTITAGDFAVLGLVDTRDPAKGLVSARAVGYGVSQLMPIVVQLLLSCGGVVAIEQPEVHIHPRLQAQVGDLLIHSVAELGNQVIVETHSEHLLLRLLRRVREGRLSAADLAILYVETLADGATQVRRLEVDSDGELRDGWPGGFFEERLEEILGG